MKFTVMHPLRGEGRTSRGYGPSTYAVGARQGQATIHHGVDYATRTPERPSGVTPVYAAASGTVEIAQANDIGVSGKYIIIEHPSSDGTYTTQYLHLSQLFVTQGQTVREGALIGETGQTGASTGPHLHFAMSLRDPVPGVKGGWLDPAPFVTRTSPRPPLALIIAASSAASLGLILMFWHLLRRPA